MKTLVAGTGEDNNFASNTFFLSVCVTMTLDDSSVGKNPWQTLRNAILNKQNSCHFQNWKKIEIKLTGRQERDFVMLSGILATVWLPPPSTTSYELARIICHPDALDQRLTKYFLTG